MTLQQLMKMTDDLAKEHGLSYQLTAVWLNEHGFRRKPFSRVTLVREQREALIAFARVTQKKCRPCC